MASLGITLNMASYNIFSSLFLARYRHRNAQPLTDDEVEFVSRLIGQLHDYLMQHPLSEKELNMVKNTLVLGHLSDPRENEIGSSYPPRLFTWPLLSTLCRLASLVRFDSFNTEKLLLTVFSCRQRSLSFFKL
jgi:hypothetical protein